METFLKRTPFDYRVVRRDGIACAALIAINCIWFVALILPFCLLDDIQYIVDNRHVWDGLSWQTAGWAFRTTQGDLWVPITWLSLALDTTLFGPHPWGYHLTNIIFHVMNTLLVYAFFRVAIGSGEKSFFAAAVYSIHPQRVESVVWAAERKDVLAVFFGLLALHAYVRYARSPAVTRRKWMWLVIGLYLFSLLSKPMLVTFPMLLLVLDVWPLGRLQGGLRGVWAGLVREKIPLLLFGMAISVDCYMILVAAGDLGSSWPVRLENATLGYFLTIRDFFYFGHLAIVYGRRAMIPWWQVAGSAAFLLGVTIGIGGLLWKRKGGERTAALAVGWLWFLGVLFPMSGILQAGVDIRADRFTYFPTLGLIIALVWGLLPLMGAERLPRYILKIGGSVIVLVFAGFMLNRMLLWRDPLVLFEHDLQFDNNGFLQQMAGSAANQQGLRERALDHFQKAGELEPGLRFLYPLMRSKYVAEDAATRDAGSAAHGVSGP